MSTIEKKRCCCSVIALLLLLSDIHQHSVKTTAKGVGIMNFFGFVMFSSSHFFAKIRFDRWSV
jgi:hypothetical protein